MRILALVGKDVVILEHFHLLVIWQAKSIQTYLALVNKAILARNLGCEYDTICGDAVTAEPDLHRCVAPASPLRRARQL